MNIVEFKNSYIDEAARLLAKRHANERMMNPELPVRFEDEEFAKKAIEALLKDHSFGVAAIRNSKLVGYMIGTINTDKNRERHTWINYAGFAIAEKEDIELIRELYAQFSNEMINHGSFNHFVMVPSGDLVTLDAWFRLGFAYEQVHGIHEILNGTESLSENQDLQIRLANKEDEESIRKLATIIMEHQAKAPVFAPSFSEDRSDYQDGYAELIDDPTVNFWLALHKDEIVGFQVYMPANASNEKMYVPDSCSSLVVGATIEYARGMGVGSALLYNGLKHVKENGYTLCETDWRMTNIESSKFWSRNGFKPIVYRLVRHIDPRILWAKGK